MINEESSHDPFIRFYDLEFPERPEESAFYIEYARKVGSPALELGCGTGKVLIPIAKSCVEIWGLDISEDMLKIAGRKIQRLSKKISSKITLVKGDMRDFSTQKRFNLVITPSGPFHSLLTTEDQRKTLRCIHRHLSRKGLLIVDLISPKLHTKAKKASVRVKEDEDGRKIKITQRGEDDFSRTPPVLRVYREYTIELKDGSSQTLSWQDEGCYITKEEFEKLLQEEGFTVTSIYRSFDKEPFDPQIASNMFFIAKLK